jgi:SSS family transporter
MGYQLPLLIIAGYFSLLLIISLITSRKADQNTFFTANRNSPWYVVAFGMIGASLSGVTFLSVPGAVGSNGFGYMQIVFGYLLGYLVIATVLLPLYYRLNLTSIYQYLEQRFGVSSYKIGAIFFLLSRVVGASLRLYLVALVLQLAVSDHIGLPFWATVLISISLIYLYTFRGGIKTVVWTDMLQTFSMLLGAGIAVYIIAKSMGLGIGETVDLIRESSYSQVFFWEGGNHFVKQFFSGAFIAIVMTGLDQDMMQKNLTCRSIGDAQKNMFWFSIVLVFVNLLFVSLGALLYLYANHSGLILEVYDPSWRLFIKDAVSGMLIPSKTDALFPILSLDYLGPVAGIIFLLGVIAAAYSSADSALTALTTSFCVDILGFEKRSQDPRNTQTRYVVHVSFALLLFVVILFFHALQNEAVIWAVFRFAGYTYGPLLGLYAFGLFTKYQVRDKWVPVVCLLSPVLSYFAQLVSPMFGYTFGFELLILNGLLTFAGLWILRTGKNPKQKAAPSGMAS